MMTLVLISAGTSYSEIAFSDAESDDNIKLLIKPSICLIDGRETECKSRFDVSWQSKSQLDGCIFIDYQRESIQCWQKQISGNTTINIEHEDSVLVSLENRALKITYAKNKIRVMNKASLKKRRLRYPWDFL